VVYTINETRTDGKHFTVVVILLKRVQHPEMFWEEKCQSRFPLAAVKRAVFTPTGLHEK